MTVEENEDLVRYRFERARETLAEVKIMVDNQLWNTAVNRLYYACFYAVSALLAAKEIYSKTHAGTRQMFHLHFVKGGVFDDTANKFYSEIFDLRHKGECRRSFFCNQRWQTKQVK